MRIELSILFAVSCLVMISIPAFAIDQTVLNQIPSKLNCTAAAKTAPAQKFEISKLNTNEPTSTFQDTSLETYEFTSWNVSVGFSNECDNDYSIMFYTQDLIDLKSGAKKSVIGMMNYFNADMVDETGSDTGAETVTATCTL